MNCRRIPAFSGKTGSYNPDYIGADNESTFISKANMRKMQNYKKTGCSQSYLQ